MRNAKLIVPVLVVIGAALLIGVFTAVSMGGSHGKAVVKTKTVGGRTILATRRGMTLYHLSVERRGHFICTTSACLAEWKPLVVSRGVTPTGVKSLGVVMRPDGRRQVAYKGGPLWASTSPPAFPGSPLGAPVYQVSAAERARLFSSGSATRS
jgi:predicted lipoprotein with Yx(FWY)xxD motif